MQLAVLVAALGYFVDVFDILLFSILRMPSLTSLGLSEAQAFSAGITILNMQLIGLLLGGVVWGIWADKIGRLSVLYGSIFLYSVANLCCYFVQDPQAYGWYRAVAGFGLAGELGAGITLVSELLPNEKRGWGATIVTGVGLCGAVAAGILSEYVSWRNCYLVGAILGFGLLFLRVRVGEGQAFQQIKNDAQIKKGSFFLLFSSWYRVNIYLRCICLGLPIIFVVFVLATFAPEIGRSLGLVDPLSAGRAVIYSYIGISIGDFLLGGLSQVTRSRRIGLFCSGILCLLLLLGSIFFRPNSVSSYYWTLALIGLVAANWALILSVTAESFGTNLRATATTSVPNMIRGTAAILVGTFSGLKNIYPAWDAAIYVGIAATVISLFAAVRIRETFGKDLCFIEE